MKIETSHVIMIFFFLEKTERKVTKVLIVIICGDGKVGDFFSTYL